MWSQGLPFAGDQRSFRSLSYECAGKRAFDVGFALLLLPLAGLVILLLWLGVRCDGGPGFFGHWRVGRNGQLFRCWKLRTMVVDAEERLAAHLRADPDAAEEWRREFKLRNDPRVTPLGRFLRRTSLDELPQVWNVLCGDMSFVGPRPIVTRELDHYGEAATRCFSVRPGLTGVWQVSGRNDVTYDERVRMDLDYVSGMSLARDVRVILRTVSVVLARTGR